MTLSLGFVFALAFITVARASTISPTCTSMPNVNDKYFCGSMVYNFNGSTYTIQDVRWGGSGGNGGYAKWKYAWGDVWHRVGGTPTYYGSFGSEASWHTNQSWSGTFAFTGVNWGGLQTDPTVYNCSTHHNDGFWVGTTWVPEVNYHVGWINWLTTGTGQNWVGC